MFVTVQFEYLHASTPDVSEHKLLTSDHRNNTTHVTAFYQHSAGILAQWVSCNIVLWRSIYMVHI